jgi:hypothetical protein
MMYRDHLPSPCKKCEEVPPEAPLMSARKVVTDLADQLQFARTQCRLYEAQKDVAYVERNRVIAALAACAVAQGWNAGTRLTAIHGWDPNWHGCVYIDLPTGQVSWHYHNDQAFLFAFLPEYTGVYDGHDTAEKYRRLAGMSPWPTTVSE